MTGLTDIPQDKMEEAMQRACDEQAEFMKKLKEDYGETVKRLGEK